MKKIILCLICSVFIIFCFSSAVHSYVLEGPKWTDEQMIMRSTGGGSNPVFNSAMVEAMGSWNGLSDFIFLNGSGYQEPCWNPGNPNIANGWKFDYSYCAAAFGSTTLAVTRYWYRGREMVQASIIFNASKPWSVFHGPKPNVFDFRRVATHELGHVSGLNHENIKPAIMNPYYSPNGIESPQADDIAGLRAIYGGGGGNRADVRAFVTRFYQQCLGREPEQPGLDGWVSALMNGSLCGANVAYGFIFSQEFINRNIGNEEFVTILYRAFFAREPDLPGYRGWVNYLYRGARREDVLNGFIYSLEFYNLCGRYGIRPY